MKVRLAAGLLWLLLSAVSAAAQFGPAADLLNSFVGGAAPVAQQNYALFGPNRSVAPLRQVAMRGGMYQNLNAAAGANSICREARLKYIIGNADLSEIRFLFTGYFIAANTDVETSVGNSIALQSALEWTGAPTVTVQVTYNGQTSAQTLASGAVSLLSDPVFPSQFGLTKFAANGSFFYRGHAQVTAGQFFPASYGANSSGEADKLSDCGSASQLLGTGAMTTPTGGSSTAALFYPVLVLGRAIGTPDIAILGTGDSIMSGFQDNGSGTNPNVIGWFPRGLDAGVNGRIPPWARFSVSGTSAHTVISNATKRSQLFGYFTHGVSEYGINDKIVLGRTAAQTLADLQTWWGMLNAGGIRYIIQSTIVPHTTSTDAWITVANQTPTAGFETGGSFRDVLNAGIVANVGSNSLNSAFDQGGAIADSVSRDKFAAPAGVAQTPDGLHPNAAGAGGLIGPAWTTAAGALN